jgi:hypothetical protein
MNAGAGGKAYPKDTKKPSDSIRRRLPVRNPLSRKDIAMEFPAGRAQGLLRSLSGPGNPAITRLQDIDGYCFERAESSGGSGPPRGGKPLDTPRNKQ